MTKPKKIKQKKYPRGTLLQITKILGCSKNMAKIWLANPEHPRHKDALEVAEIYAAGLRADLDEYRLQATAALPKILAG